MQRQIMRGDGDDFFVIAHKGVSCLSFIFCTRVGGSATRQLYCFAREIMRLAVYGAESNLRTSLQAAILLLLCAACIMRLHSD